MSNRLRYVAAVVVLTVSLASINAAYVSSASAAASMGADSVAGEWMAKATNPQWNGRFVLILTLQQLGDSVFGTYQLELDNATLYPPADLWGHFRAGRLTLEDRADRIWLSVALRGKRMDGRLAAGSSKRASAFPVSFARVDRH